MDRVFTNRTILSPPLQVETEGQILPYPIEELRNEPIVLIHSISQRYTEPGLAAGTTGDRIYYVVVGSSPVELVIQGTAWACECTDAGCTKAHGYEAVMDFFNQFRVSKNGPQQVMVAVGNSRYVGYLASLNVDAISDASREYYRFTLSMVTHLDTRTLA